MIHFKVFYDFQNEIAMLRWWSDNFTTNHYRGPFNANPKLPDEDDLLDYTTEPDNEIRDEDLPDGVSLAEDITNYLAAFDGSCQNDSLVMIWLAANSTHNGLSKTSQFLTSIRFPSGNLKLKEDRMNTFNFRLDQAPSVRYKTLKRPGWRYWNYNDYEVQQWIWGTDTVLSFFTYLVSRTYWDWDISMHNTRRVVNRGPNRAQWPKLAQRLFQLNDHLAEKALIEIIDTYWAYQEEIEQQYYAEQYYHHFNIVKLWIQYAQLPYKAKMFGNSDKEFRMVGTEYQNLVQPLNEACIIKELALCFCENATKDPIRAIVQKMDTRNFNSVIDFYRFKTMAASESFYTMKTSGNCAGCYSKKKHVTYFVGDTTWFLYFQASQHKYVTLDPKKLPLELIVKDAFSKSGLATFDLGYVSFIKFTNRADLSVDDHGFTHVVSFQNLWGRWYFYDPMDNKEEEETGYPSSARLVQVESNEPKILIDQLRLVFSAAVYFRR